jgi:hypothetical protein
VDVTGGKLILGLPKLLKKNEKGPGFWISVQKTGPR